MQYITDALPEAQVALNHREESFDTECANTLQKRCDKGSRVDSSLGYGARALGASTLMALGLAASAAAGACDSGADQTTDLQAGVHQPNGVQEGGDSCAPESKVANQPIADAKKITHADGKTRTLASQNSSLAIEIVEVYGLDGSAYRASRSGDLRHLSDLADSPRTMNILTQTQILDSGKSDLKEILDSQAGVTLGTGENGNAFGDRYVIRGHEARSDVFVDGIRDPGMTTRESFAAEQVEITKGPSSTFAGRGSSGGAVNTITKAAALDQEFGTLDASIGTDEYYRAVLDTNTTAGENTAVRLNLLKASEEIPGRAGLSRDREGVLLAGKHALSADWQVLADVYYLNAEDDPDLGSYFDQDARKPVSNPPVYAQYEDFLNTEVASGTVRLEGAFSETLRASFAARMGTTDNGYLTTGLRGTMRATPDPQAPGMPTEVLSTHQGWQQIDYHIGQGNLFWDTRIADRDSKFVFGLESVSESVDNGNYRLEYLNQPNCVVSGRRGDTASYCVMDPSGQTVNDPRGVMGRKFARGDRDSAYRIDTVSAYIMNTTELSDEWSLFMGLRQDWYDYENSILSAGEEVDYAISDSLLNGHIGLVYKFMPDANVYASFSTATNINGGESDVGGSCGYGGLCGTPEQAAQADPEVVQNIEIGTKWQLNDERLLVTAAAFRMTKSDVMESVGDSYSQIGTLNTGKNRVTGVEVSMTGAITETLSLQVSAAVMESEVLESFVPENEGLALSNFAENSFYGLLRWEPSDHWAFGAAYTYQSEMYGGQPDSSAGYDFEQGRYRVVVPEYGVVDAFANYYYSSKLNFRLNVNNVTDKEYWTAAYRSGSFMYLGDARTVRLSAIYEF